jgi:hypothetical protein
LDAISLNELSKEDCAAFVFRHLNKTLVEVNTAVDGIKKELQARPDLN